MVNTWLLYLFLETESLAYMLELHFTTLGAPECIYIIHVCVALMLYIVDPVPVCGVCMCVCVARARCLLQIACSTFRSKASKNNNHTRTSNKQQEH